MHTSLRTPQWDRLRRDEHTAIRDAGAVVIVPVAATEQHGPHLPVNTDTAVAVAVAERAAELVDEFPVVVAPVVPWGISHHHMMFSGSLTLRTSTMVALLSDLCRSFHQQGYRKIVLLNSHGGNLGVMNTVVNDLAIEGLDIAGVTYYQLADRERAALCEHDKRQADHAGEMETSLGLHLQPESVDMSLLSDDIGMAFDAPSMQRRPMGVNRSLVWSKEAPSGVTGTPRAGTAEKGRQMVEQGAAALADYLRRYQAD